MSGCAILIAKSAEALDGRVPEQFELQLDENDAVITAPLSREERRKGKISVDSRVILTKGRRSLAIKD